MAALIAIHSWPYHLFRRIDMNMGRCTRGSCVLLMGMLAACGTDAVGPTPPTADQVFWALSLNRHAVNMALQQPYDTVQLVAVPRTSSGTLIETSAPVTYAASDSTVTVTPAGLVTAHYLTGHTKVIARQTVRGITLADTVDVQVSEDPLAAPLATLSIQPYNADGEPFGSKMAMDCTSDIEGCPFLSLQATIGTGDPATDTVCNAYGCREPLLVRYTSSDPTVALVHPAGDVEAVGPGRVTFYVSTFAYGIAKTDSIAFSVGYPSRVLSVLTADNSQHPTILDVPGSGINVLTLTVGGRLAVQNSIGGGQKLEVTIPAEPSRVHFRFIADPSQAKDTLASPGSGAVEFDSAGTYTIQYRILSTGVTGSQTLQVYDYP